MVEEDDATTEERRRLEGLRAHHRIPRNVVLWKWDEWSLLVGEQDDYHRMELELQRTPREGKRTKVIAAVSMERGSWKEWKEVLEWASSAEVLVVDAPGRLDDR